MCYFFKLNISMPNKYIYTTLSWTFFLLIPFWLINATIYQALITYFLYWFMTDCVLSLFLHRWAAHTSWNPPRWLQNILATIGVVCLQGTPISWAAWHRTHHAHSDKEKDPHSPKYKSIFFIIFMHHFHDADLRRGIDRARNNYFTWLSRHESKLALILSLSLFCILDWQWFLTLWAVPVALLNVLPDLCSNVLCHSNGIVKNRLWLWPLMFGEVYHKSHHDTCELSYTRFDPSVQIVKACGWTK